MKCEQCGEGGQLYELAESKCCSDCWEQYWRDNDLGYDTSFIDFLDAIVNENHSILCPKFDIFHILCSNA